jgi:hypothetical protein
MKSLNYNKGKLRPSLILKDLQYAFKQMLGVRENGAKKYDRMNFIESKGTEHEKEFLDDNLDSIERHLLAIHADETHDDESKMEHMAHVAIRAMFALEYMGSDEELEKEEAENLRMKRYLKWLSQYEFDVLDYDDWCVGVDGVK